MKFEVIQLNKIITQMVCKNIALSMNKDFKPLMEVRCVNLYHPTDIQGLNA